MSAIPRAVMFQAERAWADAQETAYSREIDAALDVADNDDYVTVVRESLMDCLDSGSNKVADQHFAEYIGTNWAKFYRDIAHPGEQSHQEVIDDWRARWVDVVIAADDWQSISDTYGLGVEI